MDPGAPGELDQLEEARVHGRLAARQVDDVELAPVVAREVVEDPLEVGDLHVEGAVVPVVDVADRAVEVAGARDRDDGEPDLLRVARARAAVEGAAELDLPPRDRGRRAPLPRGARLLVPPRVVRETRLLRAVRRARLPHPDRAVLAGDDASRDRVLADAAEARRLVEEPLAHEEGARGSGRVAFMRASISGSAKR